jgi:hypothetical protein
VQADQLDLHVPTEVEDQDLRVAVVAMGARR